MQMTQTKKKQTEYYRHGGDETPQYFCHICLHAHTKHSKIGKLHSKGVI